MQDQIQQTLHQHFGFEHLRPGQDEVIGHLLAGHSAAAVFPTGGGKSLCYQLPALLLPGITLVVSPLIALMKDQIDALAARGVAAYRLDSSLDARAYREVVEALRGGRVRLLYVAPERFNNERFRALIDQLPISLFAVDEAHCISEWGHNFRPDYLKLATFARDCGAERILALTATAPPQVLDDICRVFDIAPGHAVRTGFYRPNLRIETQTVAPKQRDRLLLAELREQPGCAIVYVTLQRTAEEVAQRLADAGLPARAYHAGLKPETRAEIQDWFMSAERAIVVATIAFGMGIDKADIRAVYHYNLPKSLENYSQEIGRAGRDGEPARCRLLACADDLSVLENFILGDTPGTSGLSTLIDTLFGQDEQLAIDLHGLAGETDIRPLVLRTLLTYLELDGYLQGGTPFYTEYQFQPRQPSRAILDRFTGERRDFLAGIFRQARKGRTWFRLDIEATASALGTPRERIVRALDWLAEQGLFELRTSGLRHRYRVLRRPESKAALAAELAERLHRREQAELGRLRQVTDLISMAGCQTNALAAHFGEQRDRPCGHCSGCAADTAPLFERDDSGIDPALWQSVARLRREQPLLSDPRLLARLLCGIGSPRLTRNRLGRHPLFGCLEKVPFEQVLARCQDEIEGAKAV